MNPGFNGRPAVVDLRRAVALPDDVDVSKVAAAMNPAMSAWVALRRRVPLQPGQSVLVLGATGNAGSMAVQVARRLGAGRVVGAGRNPGQFAALPALGADAVVALTGDAADTAARLADAAAEVDIVIDYLWGEPAASAIMALLKGRADRSRELNWIQIGAMAGPTIELPSVALRSANFRLQGNGRAPSRREPTWPNAVADRRDQRGHDRRDRASGTACRRRGRLDRAGDTRRAHCSYPVRPG